MEDIQKRLEISKAFIVGGTPRDKILGRLKEISDLDITTGDKSIDFLVKEFSIYLSKYYVFDLRTIPDGHSSMILGNLKIDFSSNFLIPNINQILNKKGINNPTDMQKELFSRDFTCNTFLMDLNLKTISDPTNLGFKDVKEKIIKTCLDPEITFTTNKNRVVRAIYLSSKLDFDVDKKIIEWVRAHPDSIRFASEKTLSEKLNKAMELNSDRAVHLINQMNVWNFIPISKQLYPYYMKSTKGK